MKIKTKFKPGNKIRYVYEKEIAICINCDKCHRGQIVLKGDIFRCPKCGGSGKVTNRYKEYTWNKMTVRCIISTVCGDKGGIYYSDNNLPIAKLISEKICFKTEAEAIAECERLTKKTKNHGTNRSK